MSITHEHGGNVFAVARSLGISPEGILDFSASINPLGMAPGVRGALAGCLERLLHYPDKGAAELKDCLAAYHGVSSAQFAVANGSTELIHLMPRLVGGGRALIVAPAFAEYALALEKSGWQVDYFTLKSEDGFALSLPALQEKLAQNFDMLFVCNPGNPTGVLIPKGDVAALLGICQNNDTFLVLDEAFIDFCEVDSAKDLIGGYEGAVLLRSMTKFFAIPGLRLGYAIGAPKTIDAITSLQDPWSVNTAAQVAGIASLSDAAYCEATRSYVAAERDHLAVGLASLPCQVVFPSRANYLLVQLGNGSSAAELRVRLLKKGVLIRDCSNFQGLDGSFFRVAVRLREENDRLLELLGGVCG